MSNAPLRIAPRKRAIHPRTIASLTEITEAAKLGDVTAVIAVAVRPGHSIWCVRSRMSARDRMNIIAQLEYVKWLMLQDEENDVP